METILKKLQQLLLGHFKGASAELELFERPRRVGGFLVWKGFVGVEPPERVKMVYDFLSKQLDDTELRKIDLIMPLTPVEMQVRREQLEQEEVGIRVSSRHAKSS
jgi:hypothetical protein